VNALSAIPENQAGILAMLVQGSPVAPVQNDPGFLNLINVLLKPAAATLVDATPLSDTPVAVKTVDQAPVYSLVSTPSTFVAVAQPAMVPPNFGVATRGTFSTRSAARTPVAAAPAKIAEAMIRSLLAPIPRGTAPEKKQQNQPETQTAANMIAAPAAAPQMMAPVHVAPAAAEPVPAPRAQSIVPPFMENAPAAHPALPQAASVIASRAASTAPVAFTARVLPKAVETSATEPDAAEPAAPHSGQNTENEPDSEPDPQQDESRPAKEISGAVPQVRTPIAVAPQASDPQPIAAVPTHATLTNSIVEAAGPSPAPPVVPAAAHVIDTPHTSVAATLRTSEPAIVTPPPAPATHSAQEIAVRISRPEAAPVDLHVVERAGEVHVAVRTPDATLESSLRQDLPSLVRSLDRAGFHAETFTPAPITVHAAGGSFSSSMSFRDSQSDPQSGGFGQGDRSGARQEQQQQQRQRGALTWFQEMEKAA
jgi:hypothetical protein